MDDEIPRRHRQAAEFFIEDRRRVAAAFAVIVGVFVLQGLWLGWLQVHQGREGQRRTVVLAKILCFAERQQLATPGLTRAERAGIARFYGGALDLIAVRRCPPTPKPVRPGA